MLRILLADDENLTIEALKKLISGSEIPAKIIGCAANGLEVIDFLTVNEVDVLITDIKMPVMDGIALIRAIKEREFKVKVIVLSAYRDFEYAQEAINNGASGYLVKPLKKDKLFELLGELEAGGHPEPPGTAAWKERFFKSLAAGETVLPPPDTPAFEVFRGGYLVMLLEEGAGGRGAIDPAALEARMNYYLPSLMARAADGKYLFCVPDGKKTDYIIGELRGVVRGIYDSDLLVGVSLPAAGAAGFKTAYAQAQAALELCFYDRAGRCVFYGAQTPPDAGTLDRLEESLIEAVSDGQRQRAARLLEEFAGLVGRSAALPPRLVREFYSNLFFALKRVFNKKYPGSDAIELIGITVDELQTIRQFQQLSRYAAEALEEIFSLMERLAGADGENSTRISRIQEYCAANYSRDISLEDIAEYMGMTKGYLCYTYKLATGASLWDYLTGIRVEQAKKILQKPDSKAGSIGYEVGYKNPSHFGKVFKKHAGMTPIEYKRKNLG